MGTNHHLSDMVLLRHKIRCYSNSATWRAPKSSHAQFTRQTRPAKSSSSHFSFTRQGQALPSRLWVHGARRESCRKRRKLRSDNIAALRPSSAPLSFVLLCSYHFRTTLIPLSYHSCTTLTPARTMCVPTLRGKTLHNCGIPTRNHKSMLLRHKIPC